MIYHAVKYCSINGVWCHIRPAILPSDDYSVPLVSDALSGCRQQARLNICNHKDLGEIPL